MKPVRHEHESVLFIIVSTLVMLTMYGVALAYLVWAMTPAFFWSLVFFLERFKP